MHDVSLDFPNSYTHTFLQEGGHLSFFFYQHLFVQAILIAIIVLYPRHMDLKVLHAAGDAPATARSEVV